MKSFYRPLLLLFISLIILQCSCNGLTAKQKNREFPKEETTTPKKDYSYLKGMHRGNIYYKGKKTDVILTLKEEGAASITLKIQGNLYKKIGKYELIEDVLTLRTSDKEEFRFNVSESAVYYKHDGMHSTFKMIDPNTFDNI